MRSFVPFENYDGNSDISNQLPSFMVNDQRMREANPTMIPKPLKKRINHQ
jgi:hypothetical protein